MVAAARGAVRVCNGGVDSSLAEKLQGEEGWTESMHREKRDYYTLELRLNFLGAIMNSFLSRTFKN